LINDVCLFWQDHVAKYIHIDTNQDHGDEGKVQLYKVETQTLTNFDVLYITVWAVNKVCVLPMSVEQDWHWLNSE
jgi:hypothetical protein